MISPIESIIKQIAFYDSLCKVATDDRSTYMTIVRELTDYVVNKEYEFLNFLMETKNVYKYNPLIILSILRYTLYSRANIPNWESFSEESKEVFKKKGIYKDSMFYGL